MRPDGGDEGREPDVTAADGALGADDGTAGAPAVVAPDSGAHTAARQRVPSALRRWGEALLVAVLVVTFGATTVGIEGSSMSPSLHDGDRAFVPRYETWLGRLGATTWTYGDVVYFRAPGDEPRTLLERLTGGPYLIKRVVARGGDVIELRNGRVIVNGSAMVEPYLGNGPVADMSMTPTSVPEDHLFVMGDNRAPLGSRDSRAFGSVPERRVGGRAAWVVYPPLRRDAERGFVWNLGPLSAR